MNPSSEMGTEPSQTCFAPQLPQKLAVTGILVPQLMQNFVAASGAGGGGDGSGGGTGAAVPQFGQNL